MAAQGNAVVVPCRITGVAAQPGGTRAGRRHRGRAGRRGGGRRRPLFATQSGSRLFPADVWQLIRRLGKAAGLPAGLVSHLGPHAVRHAFATLYQMGRIASDASFGSSREHALPAPQRAALRCAQRARAPGGSDDLGLHGPPGSDATMMRLVPLRGVHHRCACWHHDASGSSRLHRMPHRTVPVSGTRPAPQL